MRAGLKTRVQKLEEVRTVAHQTCVLMITQTLEEIEQGWDVFDSAWARGLIPEDCLAGARMLLILPEKITNLDVWLAQGQSRQKWLDAHPGHRPGLRFVEEWELNRAKTLALQITEQPPRLDAVPVRRQCPGCTRETTAPAGQVWQCGYCDDASR